MGATIKTGELITEILEVEALGFYKSTHPDAVAIRQMLDHANGDIDLENVAVIGMLQQLMADLVLTSAVETRRASWVSAANTTNRCWTPTELKAHILAQTAYDAWRLEGNCIAISDDMNTQGYKSVNHILVAEALRS